MLHRHCSLRLRQLFLCFTNIWPFLNFKSESQGPFSEDPCQCYREAVSLTSNRYPSVPRLTDKKLLCFLNLCFTFLLTCLSEQLHKVRAYLFLIFLSWCSALPIVLGTGKTFNKQLLMEKSSSLKCLC